MYKLTLFALFLLALSACTGSKKETPIGESAQPTTDGSDAKYYAYHLDFAAPNVIDSSDWVLYYMLLEEEKGKGGISSYGGSNSIYWNIAFYNTQTAETRLLSDSLKLRIYSVAARGEEAANSELQQQRSGFVFYTITIADGNQNGDLDADDPKYLFSSDLSGQQLKQISPDMIDLVHWRYLKDAGKVLILGRRDSNRDKKYDQDDESISFVYDLKQQKCTQVFADDFNLKAKKLLNQQWGKKK